MRNGLYEKCNHTVLTYIEATERELEKEQTKMKEKPYNNHRTSMKELSDQEDIITKADKGGAVVIVGVKDYIKEAERQLNNSKNHRKLQEAANYEISK